jgi:hypothetical protein
MAAGDRNEGGGVMPGTTDFVYNVGSGPAANRKPGKDGSLQSPPIGGTDSVDMLDRQALADDFGASYGIGLLLAHKEELLVLAYRSQGWTDAYWDPKKKRIIKGKNTGVEWGAEQTAAAIQQTQWYKDRTGNQREAENARLSDPTSYNNRVNWLVQNIQDKAIEVGADLAGVDVTAFAKQILNDNYLYLSGSAEETVPDRFLNDFLAPYVKMKDGRFSGEAATNASTLRKAAEMYGVTFSDQWYVKAVQQLRSGDITQADLDQEIIAASKSRYAGLANMISETRSVWDIANPYLQMKAQVLEMNPEQLNLDDPDIQNALQGIDPNTGQVRTKTLWEFQQELRQKPEWGNTSQGRRELNNGAMKMLKDFGFVE